MAKQEANGWKYMAIIHSFLGDHSKQLEYNKKSLSIFENLNEPTERLKILNNIGDAYFNLELYDEAKSIFEKNIKNPNSDILIKIVSQKNIGKIYFKKKEFNKSKARFYQVSKLAKEHNIIMMSIASDHFLGRINIELENYQLAFEFLEKSVKNFENINFKQNEYKYALEDLLTVLLVLKENKKASCYFKKHIKISKEISEKVKNQSIKNIRFKLAITEIEQTRILLEKQNLNLKKANTKIKLQQEALKSANRELAQFAQIVSHDIREPIRTINSFSKLLAHEIKDHLTDNAKEFIGFIDSCTNRIITFVDDTLKYSAIDIHEVEVENINCNEILDIIRLNLQFQLKKHQGQLIVEKLPNIKAHRSLILQVFQNIISNGLKFRQTGVTPIVKVSGKETEVEYYFEISDNGIGIKEEDKANIFKIFKQLNTKTEFEGSGIGLNTVLKILKKYKGSINLESTFGEGTTFKISIPKSINDN